MENNSDNASVSIKQPISDWWWLGTIVALSALIRLLINYSTDLMPGLISAYYPIQVRALIETGKLGFPDFPLVFYLEAGLAKLFYFFHLCDLNSCILNASKLVDSLLYPLIAIPAFLLARYIFAHNSSVKTTRWLMFIPALFTAVSFFSLIMMADFQKNAVGLMWSLFYIYFFYQAINEDRLSDYFLTGFFFILTGITHIGGLGLVVAFSLLLLVLSTVFIKEKRGALLKMAEWLALVSIIVTVLLYYFDPERLSRLASYLVLPLQMFKDPVIFAIFGGKFPLGSDLFIEMVIGNILALLGLILFYKKRAIFLASEKALLLSATLLTLLMVSPFLEQSQLAERLNKMVYIPATIVLIFLLKYIASGWKKNILIVGMLIIISVPLPIVAKIRSAPIVSDEAYRHLLKLKPYITNPEKTLILTRHGLEYWTAWALDTDVGSGRDLTSEKQNQYQAIYYLRQVKGQGNFGPHGPGSTGFPEVLIPSGAPIVFQDDYFILAKAAKGKIRVNYEKQN